MFILIYYFSFSCLFLGLWFSIVLYVAKKKWDGQSWLCLFTSQWVLILVRVNPLLILQYFRKNSKYMEVPIFRATEGTHWRMQEKREKFYCFCHMKMGIQLWNSIVALCNMTKFGKEPSLWAQLQDQPPIKFLSFLSPLWTARIW